MKKIRQPAKAAKRLGQPAKAAKRFGQPAKDMAFRPAAGPLIIEYAAGGAQ
jgi:hypothetical protein